MYHNREEWISSNNCSPLYINVFEPNENLKSRKLRPLRGAMVVVYCEDLGENWPCYNCNALYILGQTKGALNRNN